MAIPTAPDELIEHHTLTDEDLALVMSRRGGANRLGVAVQLCLLRSPGIGLAPDQELPAAMLQWVADQLDVNPTLWSEYARREETRWEHAALARDHVGIQPFTGADHQAMVDHVTSIALSTDISRVLAELAVAWLRGAGRVVPAVTVIERACGEATAQATRAIRQELVRPLTRLQRANLDRLLDVKPGSTITWLSWIRQTPSEWSPTTHPPISFAGAGGR